MPLEQKTILVDGKTLKLWELKHPGESFSAWVRQCILRDVRPDVQPVGVREEQTVLEERDELGFTEKEWNQFSKSTGVSVEELKEIGRRASKPDSEQVDE